MKTAAFEAGILLAGLILLTIFALEGPGLGKKAGLVAEPEAKPVLVFVIPDDAAARSVRAAVAPERILWQGDRGIALVGQRVVASDLDGASEVIMQAGWVDHPIRIVRLEGRFDELQSGGGATTANPASRMSKLRALARKPMLTHSEQLFILSAMNDGIAI